MQTAFSSVVPMRGDLRIVVRYADTGKVHWRYEIRNTITYVALGNLVTLIAQKTYPSAGDLNDPMNSAISYLRVGDVNTAPTRANTNLLGVILDPLNMPFPYSVPLLDANKTLTTSNPFEAKFTATIPGVDLVGETLREAGLFTRGSNIAAPPGEFPDTSGFYPELFARQVHPDILVNAAFVIDYDWRIAFTS